MFEKDNSIDYINNYPVEKICKACFKQIEKHNDKITGDHHIRSVGAGGNDSRINKIQLCFKCHCYYHNNGWIDFVNKYPHLKNIVEKAKNKDWHGRKYNKKINTNNI